MVLWSELFTIKQVFLFITQAETQPHTGRNATAYRQKRDRQGACEIQLEPFTLPRGRVSAFIFQQKNLDSKNVLLNIQEVLPRVQQVLPYLQQNLLNSENILPHSNIFLPHSKNILPRVNIFLPDIEIFLPDIEIFLPNIEIGQTEDA